MTTSTAAPVSPHMQPVEVLVLRAAKALYKDATAHIDRATPFLRLEPALQSTWRRRARLALVAAFPALVEAGEVR